MNSVDEELDDSDCIQKGANNSYSILLINYSDNEINFKLISILFKIQ